MKMLKCYNVKMFNCKWKKNVFKGPVEAFVVARQFFWRKYVDRKKTFVTSNLVLLQRTSLWTFEQNWHFAKKHFCQKIIFCEFQNIYSKSFKLFFSNYTFYVVSSFQKIEELFWAFYPLFEPELTLTHTYTHTLTHIWQTFSWAHTFFL